MKAINRKQADILADKLGLDILGGGDGLTFFATNEKETDLYEFDSKKERDAFVAQCNDYTGRKWK